MTVSHIFKVAIIGSGGVGKTSFIKRHTNAEFIKQYNPTIGIDNSNNINFNTNLGENIIFNCIDKPGQEFTTDFSILSDIDCAIIMFDVTSRLTYYSLEREYNILKRYCKNDIPIVLCGNKVDIKNRKVKNDNISFHHDKNMKYYDISVKSNYNYEKPFSYFIKRLLNNDDIEISSSLY